MCCCIIIVSAAFEHGSYSDLGVNSICFILFFFTRFAYWLFSIYIYIFLYLNFLIPDTYSCRAGGAKQWPHCKGLTPWLGEGLKFRRATCHAGKAFPPPMLAAAMGETLAKLCQFPDGLPGAPRPHLPKHSHLRKRPTSGSKKTATKRSKSSKWLH